MHLYGGLLVAICTAVMGLLEPKQCMTGLQEVRIHKETKAREIPLPSFIATEFVLAF